MVRLGVWIGAVLLALSGAVAAQPFPSKPITLIVPFGPGSGTDTVARLVGQKLSERLGQSVVVENKAGANGVLAAQYVARAAPDGHTLLVATNTTHSANPGGMVKNVPYDAIRDFAPVTRVGNYIFALILNRDVPAKTLPELIDYAKKNPGKLTVASGNGTGIVAAETLKYAAGIDILHVPYKSTPPALNDVLGGRISMMFIDLTTGLSHIQAGTVRAIAVTTLERTRLLPELPSLNEAAVPNYDITSYCAIFAPAGTPKEIVTKLNAELRQVIENPEVRDKLATAGFEAFASTPEELGTFIEQQLVLWTRLIKQSGIEAQ